MPALLLGDAPGGGVGTDRRMFLLKADIAVPDARLAALRAEFPADGPPPAALVAEAVGAAVGVAVRRVEPSVSRGTFRWAVPVELADGRAVLARVNRLRHEALAEGLALEARLAPVVVGGGVRAPAVFALDVDGGVLGAGFGVVERFVGATLASVDGDEAAVGAALRSLGTVLARLHAIVLEGHGALLGAGDPAEPLRGRWERWDDYLHCRLAEHVGACVDAGALSDAEAARVLAVIAGASGSPHRADRLLHGDAGGTNVVLAADGTVGALTDWEDALVGDPLFDVASCAAFHPERRWPALFEGYYGTRALPAPLERPFWSYFLRIALARTVMRRRFAVRDLPGREPAARRLQRALRALQELDT